MQKALPWLKRRHSREHQVPGSEAELGALDFGQWWSTGVEFFRRGLRWRSMAREQSSCGRSREAARESEEWSAAGSADEGGRVEAEAGRGCRAAGVAGAWSPRGGRALTRSGRDSREWRGAARRQARRARGWAGPRRGGLAWAREVRWAGFGRGPRNGATARERRKHFSKFLFLINFQILVFKYHFEQENDIF